MTEVIFFTYGDSANASTWSNVPYLFTSALEKNGILVRRINLLQAKNFFQYALEKVLHKVYNFCFRSTTYSYERSPLFSYFKYLKIEKAVKKYPNADYCIFACFDFYNKFSNIPSLLFSDWTYEILINQRLGRAQTKQEKRFTDYQTEAINNANIVISLFKLCAKMMKQRYNKANIKHLGINVVNNLNPYPSFASNLQQYIKNKQRSKTILFVGNKKYISAASLLIEAFNKLSSVYPDSKLHLIGLTKNTIEALTGINVEKVSDRIYCHGYLRKEVPEERELYYDLMEKATVFVNTSPKWGGYSSTIEAMYYYTPIVVAPYNEFVDEFGENINFGLYESEFSSSSVANDIESIFSSDTYEEMSNLAHNIVKDYNWDEYVRRVIQCMEEEIKGENTSYNI